MFPCCPCFWFHFDGSPASTGILQKEIFHDYRNLVDINVFQYGVDIFVHSQHHMFVVTSKFRFSNFNLVSNEAYFL